MDPDTSLSKGSWDAALLAAGSGLMAIDALIEPAKQHFVLSAPQDIMQHRTVQWVFVW